MEAKFFTLHKLWWTLVYDLMFIGLISAWIFVNVQVLGNDVEISTPSYSSMRKK